MSETRPATEGVSEERIKQFEESKMNRQVMIHRLRDWEAGDVVFGYDVVGETSSTGKTFRRNGEYGEELAIEKAINAMRNAPAIGELSEDSQVFAWVGKIERVRTEPRDPHDPGEPPLKHAQLEQVSVLAARDE
jgi:hypothetical protein